MDTREYNAEEVGFMLEGSSRLDKIKKAVDQTVELLFWLLNDDLGDDFTRVYKRSAKIIEFYTESHKWTVRRSDTPITGLTLTIVASTDSLHVYERGGSKFRGKAKQHAPIVFGELSFLVSHMVEKFPQLEKEIDWFMKLGQRKD